MKTFKGKAIYNPSGKAGEYSYWAVNFYNGCSAKCEYCYNRHGITAKVLGADKPTLKKGLLTEDAAFKIFCKEVDQNIDDLRKHGLFFNFVSDPLLKETIDLNAQAAEYCVINEVPVKFLTKQTWWLEDFLKEFEETSTRHPYKVSQIKPLYAFGFTLTGHDELEPGASKNMDRIVAMYLLHDAGFKTWASIEPIIDVESSQRMLEEICNHVDLVKIGLRSGKKYNPDDIKDLTGRAFELADIYGFKIYLKDSLIKAIDVERHQLPSAFCVQRDFKLHEF